MTNDFRVFAGAVGANVLTQSEYLATSELTSGMVSGTASSRKFNKVWRQSSIIASMIGDFIVAHSGQDAIDDGTTATLLENFSTAVTGSVGRPVFLSKSADYTAIGTDAGAIINYTAAPHTLSLTAAATLGNGWSVMVRNAATSGYLTIDPNGSEQIDGGTTCVLPPGADIRIVCDGTGFATFGWGRHLLISETAISAGTASYAVSVPDDLLRYAVSIDVQWRDLSLSAGDALLLQFGSGTDGSPSWTTSGYAGSAVFSYGSGGSGDDNTVYTYSTYGPMIDVLISGATHSTGIAKVSRMASSAWLLSGQSNCSGHGMNFDGFNSVSGMNRVRIIPASGATISGGSVRVSIGF